MSDGVEKRSFEAEVSKLLHMMVHSVYSDRDVFLRELISNSADACDKLRFEAIANPDLIKDQPDFRIVIEADKDKGTLTISDNGVGMGREELIDNLGTIARSGTAAFADKLSGDTAKDVSLIGQFGVGFYASFMVADKVTVISRRAGDEAAHSWISEGLGDYEIRPAERGHRGTDIVLHLKDDAKDFLDTGKLDSIVKTYSGHIPVPVAIREAGKDEDSSVSEGKALWTRQKSNIKPEEYTEFYRHVSHGFDDPALTLHYRAEGVIEYSVLLFVPSVRGMDLFDPARKPRVKLYVRRVFITDDTAELLPGWLRFLQGVIDSQDLPLNVSREMLQNNAVIRNIRKAVTNKILSELQKCADKDADTYAKIWAQFGAVLKEGLYEDQGRQEALLKLTRFRTSEGGEDWVSLADYVARMKEKQSKIYYITGADARSVARQPQLEGFKARGVEVLLLSDPVDDFWLQATAEHDGRPFASVTRGGADLKDLGAPETSDDAPEAAKEGDLATLAATLKGILGDAVADVRGSDRLTDTPCCLVADDAGMDMHLERILKMQNQLQHSAPKILELNPAHPLIKALVDKAGTDGAVEALGDPAWLLLDQARVLEGEPVDDPAAFAKRLSQAMVQGLA